MLGAPPIVSRSASGARAGSAPGGARAAAPTMPAGKIMPLSAEKTTSPRWFVSWHRKVAFDAGAPSVASERGRSITSRT